MDIRQNSIRVRAGGGDVIAASKSAHRAKKRARGLVRVELWVPREIRRTVRAFLRRLVMEDAK